VSTDYVFDGTKSEPYVEWDQTNPLSVYGKSKLGGERELHDGSLVVRTSWVCGEHGANMVKTALRLAEGDGEVAFVDDQRGHPTFAADLAEGIHRLVIGRHTGTFHVTNQGPVSWWEFVREIFELVGADPARVRAISTAELDPPRPAPRPANSVLDNFALRNSGLPLLPDHRESLERLVRRLTA
jgi:dTDP-4-dehydrorhamnose reductase